MEVLVCVKRVPGPGSTIVLTADAQAVDTRHLGFTIGPHEECAVEEAVRIVSERGGRVTAMTVGPAEAGDQVRFAISMGADRGVLVDVGEPEPDPEMTAEALVQAIRNMESDGAPFDLILFGNESADAGNHQVGVRVAHALARPIVGGVKGIDLDDAPDGNVRLHCDRGEGVDVFQARMPAVAAVKEGLNLPRYPTMRGRLRAAKAELQPQAADVGAGGLRKTGLRHPPAEEVPTVILGHGAEAAGPVVDVFEELGVV